MLNNTKDNSRRNSAKRGICNLEDQTEENSLKKKKE